MTPTKYEYHRAPCKGWKEETDTLDRCGQEGWELVSVFIEPYGSYLTIFYFKRPLPNTEDNG